MKMMQVVFAAIALICAMGHLNWLGSLFCGLLLGSLLEETRGKGEGK